jgi:hypothetical protein
VFRTLLTLRLTTAGMKWLYVLAAWSSGLPFPWSLPDHPVFDVFASLVGAVLTVVGVWYGTRVFRGPGEPIAPARAWWRWTAWPTASWWLTILFVWLEIALVINMVRMKEPAILDLVADALFALSLAVLALGYLISAVRLTATGVRKPLLPARRTLQTPPKLG